MNAAHLHLIVNHFPIAGFLFSLPLLSASIWRRNPSLGVAGLFAVVGTGLITIPSYLSGDPSEEIVEHLPGVSERLIHAHEESAEKAVILIAIVALLAVGALILAWKRKALPTWAVPAVLAGSCLSVLILGWTNNLGGQIRHSEIRSTISTSAPAETGARTENDD